MLIINYQFLLMLPEYLQISHDCSPVELIPGALANGSEEFSDHGQYY